MESALNIANNYGLAGLVIFALFGALLKLHKSNETDNSKVFDLCVKLLDLFANERTHSNDKISELTKVVAELSSKLPAFCGERRNKPAKNDE